MKTNFEERRQNRLEAYKRLAGKNKQESESSYQFAKKVGSFIPMGQPILVGHHSEGRHRRDLAKIDNAMRKSIEADEKAAYYEGRAKHIEADRAIYSDDPNGLEKLREKLARLLANQETMKAVNKIVKSKAPEAEKVELIVRDGLLTEKQAIEILKPDFCGRIGFPAYALSNNNGVIANTRKRIEQLERLESKQTTETEINGVRIVENIEANRLQLFFDGKPSDEIRTKLKRGGFRWSPSEGAWQRHISNYAMYEAKNIVNSIQ